MRLFDRILPSSRLASSLGIGWLLIGLPAWGAPGITVLTPALHYGCVSFRAEIDDAAEVPATATLAWGLVPGGDAPESWEHRIALAVAGVGVISTNVAVPDATVVHYRWFAVTPSGSYAPASRSVATARARPLNNITFVTASDIHLTTNAADIAAVHTAVEHINALAGRTYPDGIGLNGVTVDPPRGVIMLGDMIDSGAKFSTQWPAYTNIFGLTGERRLAYPLYEGWGNHDLTSDLVADQIRDRNPARADPLTHLSTNGYHYSWDWDFLHLVQLNLFPGDLNDSVKGYDPKASLSFLVDDLARCVGDSGRPVALFMHYDVNDLGWWNDTEHQRFYDAISNYNVICIVYGHTGTGVGLWNNATNGSAAKKFRTVNDGNLPARSFVFNVTTDRISVCSWEVASNSWYLTRQCKDAVTAGRWQETLAMSSATNVTPAGAREGVAFDAGATNNYGRAVEYRYLWGGSVTSAWGAASRTNLWAEPGSYAVRVQARCASNTNLVSAWFDLPMTVPLRFRQWALEQGLGGDLPAAFRGDANGNGMADGLEYAFGGNWSNGVPEIAIRTVGGLWVIEVPLADGLRPSANVAVESSGGLEVPDSWETNLLPSGLTDGKPADRQWWEPPVDGGIRYFRVRGQLRE